MTEHAAKVCWVANRSADVRTGFNAGQPGCERGGGAAGRASWNVFVVVGVVGCAVDVVVALKVGEHQRHVGFAENDDAGRLQFLDRLGVVVGDIVFPGDVAPGGGRAFDVVRLLDRHGYAVQRAQIVAVRDRRIGGFGLCQGLIANVDDERIQLTVIPIHSVEVVAQQLFAADLFVSDFRRKIGRGRECQLAHLNPPKFVYGNKPVGAASTAINGAETAAVFRCLRVRRRVPRSACSRVGLQAFETSWPNFRRLARAW